MIVFSELLKSFINEKNISVKKLAANVQMDRTLIQKYMSGSRVPKNYREVQKLADGMLNVMGRFALGLHKSLLLFGGCLPLWGCTR